MLSACMLRQRVLRARALRARPVVQQPFLTSRLDRKTVERAPGRHVVRVAEGLVCDHAPALQKVEALVPISICTVLMLALVGLGSARWFGDHSQEFSSVLLTFGYRLRARLSLGRFKKQPGSVRETAHFKTQA